MEPIVTIIFITISVVGGYISGWHKGRKDTIDNLFKSGFIDAELYKKLMK